MLYHKEKNNNCITFVQFIETLESKVKPTHIKHKNLYLFYLVNDECPYSQLRQAMWCVLRQTICIYI